MDFSFEIDVKDTYLYVTCSGEYNLKSVKEAFLATFDHITQYNLVKALLDIRNLDGHMSTMERYAIGEFLAAEKSRRGYLNPIQIGVIGNPPLIEPQRFGQTVARNHGVFIKIETDLDKLLAWMEIE